MSEANTLSLEVSMKFKLDTTGCDMAAVQKIAAQMRLTKLSLEYISDIIERNFPEEAGPLPEFRWSSCTPDGAEDG